MLIRLLSKLAMVATFASTLAVTGCDNGGNDSAFPGSSTSSSSSSASSSSSGTLELANVYVAFPPPVSQTQEASIQVRGAVQNLEGISAIQVNGVAATTADGWATWSADVPLMEGINSLEVTSVDADAVATPAATLSVTRTLDLTSPRDMVHDSDNGRLLLIDSARNSVMAVDTASGVKSLLSPPPGTENLIVEPLDMTLHRASNSVVIRQYSTEHPLVRVDLTTGAQSWLTLEHPDALDEAMPLAFTAAGTDLYISAMETFYVDSSGARVPADTDNATRRSLGMINRVDPATGELQPLSRYGLPGNTASLGTISSIGDHPDSPHLYALDLTVIEINRQQHNLRSIKKIDKATGERSWFFPATETEARDDADAVEGEENTNEEEEAPGEDKDTEITFSLGASTTDIHLDYPNNALWALDQNRLIKIDLQTAKATVVYGNDLPTGIKYSSFATRALSADFDNGILYTADDALDRIIATQLSDSTRRIVSSESGDDPDTNKTLISPSRVALDVNANQVFITDKAMLNLTRLDLTTGVRSTVVASENATAEKPSLYYPAALDFMDGPGRLLVVGNAKNDCIVRPSGPPTRLLSVDAATGNRKVLVTYSVTSFQVCDAVWEPGSRTLYTAEQHYGGTQRIGAIGRIRLLDNDNFQYTVFSRTGTPDETHPLTDPRTLVLDAPHKRLLVADAFLKGIVAVDVDSGARTLFSPHDAAVPMTAPRDMILNPEGTEAWVLDANLDGVISVDLETGKRRVLVQAPDGLNGLAIPSAMALHPIFNYLVIADPGRGTIMALDLETSQLVRIAR